MHLQLLTTMKLSLKIRQIDYEFISQTLVQIEISLNKKHKTYKMIFTYNVNLMSSLLSDSFVVVEK